MNPDHVATCVKSYAEGIGLPMPTSALQVRDPQLVGCGAGELASDQVSGPSSCAVWEGGADPADPDRAVGAHQTFDGAPGGRGSGAQDPFTTQLVVDFPGSVEPAPGEGVHADDLGRHLLVTPGPGRGWAPAAGVVGLRSDRHTVLDRHPADRRDPEGLAVGVDERAHHGRRGSSSRAKNEEAAKGISLARLSSRTSACKALVVAVSAVVVPVRARDRCVPA
ncbi:hypothetical protein GALL_345920 [mine drainage metagenome]|uniref:Uncharacterized protein n=1 Tax=mine drainage metagenome TaxID=410659 RepID=A0A1J5QUU0_9ZZZZ